MVVGGRTNLPVLDDGPLEALDVERECGQGGEQDDGLDTDLLPLVVLRLSGPVQESNDILSHLRSSGWGT